jgi:hypothetical protein
MSAIAKAARKLLSLYLHSMFFLLWSCLCICLGAAWAFIAIRVVLKADGVLP